MVGFWKNKDKNKKIKKWAALPYTKSHRKLEVDISTLLHLKNRLLKIKYKKNQPRRRGVAPL
jgi:hypothetical protein